MADAENRVVRLVDQLLHTAIEKGASDIHIEPTADVLRVRMRIDGVLQDMSSLPLEHAAQLTARFKVLAHMNVTQKRMPQDGKFVVKYQNTPIDIRLSCFPGVLGEKLVVRILDPATHMLSIDNLGFSPAMQEQFTSLIQKPSGFLLVTGPTGSGKTTTLYAALRHINKTDRNIVTLEDPVEYSVSGITQAQINSEIGFSFANGIRSLLRQDPDIIMIGEIRDKETARTAIEAAMTGHLVLSTLHTNDAVSAIVRLMDMGIEPYLINASLTGILAQRLVRTMCNACVKENSPTVDEQKILHTYNVHTDSVAQPHGCVKCMDTGYKGRAGLFELLVMSPTLRASISESPRIDALYAQAYKEGLQSLTQSAAQKIIDKKISVAECMRTLW